jgi:hypothetical protein
MDERFTIPRYPRPAASVQMLHKLLANPELQLLKKMASQQHLLNIQS